MGTEDLKNASQKDWHPADIKAALHKKGITLAAIAEAHGLTGATTLSAALTRSYPLNEKRIADALGIHPKEIWPSRYNEDGSFKQRGFRSLQHTAFELVRKGQPAATGGKNRKAA